MRRRLPLPAQAILVELFDYDPESGELCWRGKASRKHHPGMAAGTLHHSGYLQVAIDGTIYMAHRLIWKRQTGRDPFPEVDHRNGVRSDNRWRNLREATSSQQNMNKITPNAHRGVHWAAAHRRFGAQIKANGERRWLGLFDTAEEACAAYRKAAARLHGDFAKAKCACR